MNSSTLSLWFSPSTRAIFYNRTLCPLQQERSIKNRVYSCLKLDPPLTFCSNEMQISICGSLLKWNFRFSFFFKHRKTINTWKYKLFFVFLQTLSRDESWKFQKYCWIYANADAKNSTYCSSTVFSRAGEKLQYSVWSCGCLSVCCNVV